MSSRLVVFACLFAGAAAPVPAQTNPEDRAKVTELSKLFLRDSAELPMDVSVTTVVTDVSGKQRHRSQSTVHFLFRGYNRQNQRFSFHANSGWFNTGALRDSMIGDYAVFAAFSMLAPGKEGEIELQVRPDPTGAGFVVTGAYANCHGFAMEKGRLFPRTYCPSVEIHAAVDAAGNPMLDRFQMDIRFLPAPADLAYLGPVEVRRVHMEGDIQQTFLAGDPKPYLAPRQVTTTIGTDHGKIVVTNVYSMTPERTRKP